jgi:hypothetical protein
MDCTAIAAQSAFCVLVDPRNANFALTPSGENQGSHNIGPRPTATIALGARRHDRPKGHAHARQTVSARAAPAQK